MRLYLASRSIGNHGDRLLELVGENKKVIHINNAKDCYKPRDYEEKNVEIREMFGDMGLEVVMLDLRKYFGKKEELGKFVDGEKPGLIFASGGNTFILRRAMRQSGFDEILKRDLMKDKYVYAGGSAGSVVMGPSLEGFQDDDNPKKIPEGYGYEPETTWEGLGIIGERIIPHADADFGWKSARKLEKEFREKGWKYEMMNDSDVLVVDGERREVLR